MFGFGVSLSAAAIAATALVSGAVTAEAAAQSTASTSTTSAAPDVGSPAEVVPGASAIGPEKSRAAGRDVAMRLQSIQVDVLADGARLRARVPNGQVVALAYRSNTAWGGCQIPGSDGHLWGWLYVLTAHGWRSGWMRHDLWDITAHTYPGGGSDPTQLPWC